MRILNKLIVRCRPQKNPFLLRFPNKHSKAAKWKLYFLQAWNSGGMEHWWVYSRHGVFYMEPESSFKENPYLTCLH